MGCAASSAASSAAVSCHDRPLYAQQQRRQVKDDSVDSHQVEALEPSEETNDDGYDEIDDDDGSQQRSAWSVVRSRLTDTGVDMFLRLFQRRPDLLGLFSSFYATEDKIDAGNPQLRRHAAAVMELLDLAIGGSAEGDRRCDSSASERLRSVGKTHRLFCGFEPEHFGLIRRPFLEALAAVLGQSGCWTPEVRRLFEADIDWALDELRAGFDSF